MTISLWSTVFVDSVMSIPAAFLNYVRTNLPRAVDGVGGGVITPSSVIEVQGTAGLKVNGSGSAARLQYGAETLTRAQTSLHRGAGTTAAGTIAVPASGEATQMLDRVPDDSRLTAVTVYHDRTNLGTLPTTRVTATVRKRVLATNTVSIIGGPTVDPTSTLAAYEAFHGFDVTIASEDIDNAACVYWVELAGEAGANTSQTTMYSSTATFSVTSQDKAP